MVAGDEELDHDGDGVWEPAYLVVDTFVKCDTQRPPIDFKVVARAFVYLRGEVCQCSRFARERFARSKIRCHILG